VRPAPTDLGQLTDDVVDGARVLGNRRWQVEARADAVVVVDAQRVTQAWLQLIANALAFTAEGARIRVGSAVRGDRALLWVHDDGAGVAPGDQARIFERFERGAGTRSGRRTDGAGLGLPIVAAIAAAHGGSVRLDRPAPDARAAALDRADPWSPLMGARFVLDLPAHEVAAEHTDQPIDYLVEQ